MRKVVLLLGIGLGLLSCSEKENLPTEALAKQNVAEVVMRESKDKVELLEFSKTNALKEKMFDAEYYTVEFDGKVAYKQDGYSLANEHYKRKKGFLLVEDEKPILSAYSEYRGRFKEVKKGQKRNIKGEISFIKKEDGWEKGRVYIYLKDKVE